MVIRKTYAARGLLDFQMALTVGGAIIRLIFSGGAMGSNGVLSAKYSTDNHALQRIIEKSPQFTSGRIYLFSETVVESHPAENLSSDNPQKNKTDNTPQKDDGHITTLHDFYND